MIKKPHLFLSLFLVSLVSFSQESYSPSKVSRAAFFDKTSPLIEMEIRQPLPSDNSWKDGVVGNESLLTKFKSSENQLTDRASLQDLQGNKKSKGPVVNIGGIGNINGVVPPDTDGDVGPNHYVQMINLSFAVYDKQGNKLYGPVANSTLWNGFPGPWSGTNDGDPIVLYDEIADRWMASQFAIYTSNGKYYELIAVSQTPDPLGAWYRYAFEFDEFPDYPKLSVWEDGYYATFHIFNGNFQGSAFVSFEREKMLVGDPDAQMVYFGEFPTRFGYLPSDVDGDPPSAGTPCNFVGINFGGNHTMEVWEMSVDWDNTANSQLLLQVVLPTASFNNNLDGIPQPGGNQLDVLNGILMFRLPSRDFGNYRSMVANHTVKVGNHAGIRWYELRNDGGNWYIYQQGTYSPDNLNRWLGSIAIQADGTIALGYSVASNTVYPSIRYTGRSPDAPLGEMNMMEIEVASGVSSQNSYDRWGDYACMSADPENDSLFWFTTEYMPSGGWGTRIISFDFGEILPPVAFAGVDTTICADILFNLIPSAQFYSDVQWETSGDGFFQNQNTLFTKYWRGSQDVANGSVLLTLTVSGFQPGWEISDEMVLSIVKMPEAIAGNDTTINVNLVEMNGAAISYAAVEWSTAGDGVFNNPSLLNTIYTLGSDDIFNGQVILTLTAFGQEICGGEDTDNVKIYYNPATTIENNGVSENRIEIIPNPSKGKFDLVVKGLTQNSYRLMIRDFTGRLVLEKNLTNSNDELTEEIDLSNNEKGIYILEIVSENGRFFEKIILK